MSEQIKPVWSVTLRESNILSVAVSYLSNKDLVVAFPEYVGFEKARAEELVQGELIAHNMGESRELVPECKFPWRINRANVRYLKEREQDIVCYVSKIGGEKSNADQIKKFFDLAAEITLADEDPRPCSFMIYTPSNESLDFFERDGFETRATKLTTDPDQPKLRINYLVNHETGEEVYLQTPLENGESPEVVRQIPFSVDKLTKETVAEFFHSQYW